MGLASAGQSEGQDVDTVLQETALGQMVQLLTQRQGHPVMLEGFPGLARGEPGRLTQPIDASLAAIVGFLFQHLKEDGQCFAVARGGETVHRLGAHGGQLELVAQLADTFLHDSGVGVNHPHTAATAILLVSRRRRFSGPAARTWV